MSFQMFQNFGKLGYVLSAVALREEHRLCLRTGCWRECLYLRGRKWQGAGEDCIMRSFMTCTLHRKYY